MSDLTSNRDNVRYEIEQRRRTRQLAGLPAESAEWHYASRPFDRAKMHEGGGATCIICALPWATTWPVPVHYASRDLYGPWTPVGSVVVDGITFVPGSRLSAADTAEIYGRVTGARLSHATVVRVAVDGSHQVVDEATWSQELTETYGPGILAAYDRDQVNRRVRSVFELAQARRWELAQIQSPAVRDALSLT